jgi:hypothetical protein
MAKDGAMPEEKVPLKKYRLGNQAAEYELITKYLGWFPEKHKDWEDWATKDFFTISKTKPELLTIVSADGKEKVILLMDHALSRAAFPLSFLGEERSKKWWWFYKVATKENPDVKFIIPLH